MSSFVTSVRLIVCGRVAYKFSLRVEMFVISQSEMWSLFGGGVMELIADGCKFFL